jgi:hypothetical protein
MDSETGNITRPTSTSTAGDAPAVAVISSVIIINALLYLLSRDQTYVHIDAIAHVNKARGLFDNLTPGIRQLGSIWLPLQHLLIAPLAWFDFLWITGLAGSLISAACFVGTSVYLLKTGIAWTGSRFAGWMSFLLFALNPRLIYFFTTPMTEPLTIFCAIALVFYLIRWTQTSSWRMFGLAALMACAGTLSRYEGWAIAAAALILVPIIAPRHRVQSTILFAGAAVAGPMLWMLFNMIYFDDPLMFTYGTGSAIQYAEGETFITAGDWLVSFKTYFINVAYCVNAIVLWLAIAGLALSMLSLDRGRWRSTLPIAGAGAAAFAFYVFNLYSNRVPLLMPGFLENDPLSMYNVRYGTVMAATLPLLAAFFIHVILRQADRNRAFALVMILPIFLQDHPIPWASLEPVNQQLTANLLYKEGIHNQSFWMPPFVDIARRLQAEIETSQDESSLILTNTRIIHPVVWATGIPMRRFLHEMNQDHWNPNFQVIDPRVRWVITEEGDQLWQGRGKFLEANFVEVARAKTNSTGIVHLYRRPD